MDLQIRFENGSMVIHLREFLNARNIKNRGFYKKVLENIE